MRDQTKDQLNDSLYSMSSGDVIALASKGGSTPEASAMANKSPPAAGASAPIETLNFETALKELEEIVSRLEQGEVDLEDSIALYERGQALKAHCEKKLKAAEGRLEKIIQGPHGAASTEQIDIG
jgi:exodeoxyribonuclease VII small subunit